jgi:choline dehydrogenase-like flavoprotein
VVSNRREVEATWACMSTTCWTGASTRTRACRSVRQHTSQAPSGTDPAASALDVNCKAHDVDNIYVVDTSFFPSIAAVNASLTAIANALRVGDHITERLH